MKPKFPPLLLLFPIIFLILLVIAGSPPGPGAGLKFNVYTTNTSAAADAHVASIAGTAAGALTNFDTRAWTNLNGVLTVTNITAGDQPAPRGRLYIGSSSVENTWDNLLVIRKGGIGSPSVLWASDAPTITLNLGTVNIQGNLDTGAGIISGDGSGLTNLDGSKIQEATIPLSALAEAVNVNASALTNNYHMLLLEPSGNIVATNEASHTNYFSVTPEGVVNATEFVGNVSGSASAANNLLLQSWPSADYYQFGDKFLFETNGGAQLNFASWTNGIKATKFTGDGSNLAGVMGGYTTNVEAYGVAHNGRWLRGNVSADDHLTITVGTVTTNDIGANIRVRFGKGPAQDLVTTVLDVTTGNTVLVLDVGAETNLTGADICIAKTNDTPYFQAAVDDIYAKGGGTIYCPPGIYWLSGPIMAPLSTATGGYDANISIVGANSATLYVNTATTYAVPPSMTVLYCGQEVGDGGALIFGAEAPAPHVGRPRFTFRNILFRAPTNPNGTLVNASNLISFLTYDCIWDTGFGGEHDPRIPIPTYESTAVRYPKTGNYGGGQIRMSNGLIMGGFMNALVFSEHFLGDNLAICNCFNGIVPFNAIHAVFTKLALESCQHPICGTNATAGAGALLYIFGLHCENAQDNYWWTSRTRVYDPFNVILGELSVGNITGQEGWTNVGAKYLSLREYAIDPSAHQTFRSFPGSNYMESAYVTNFASGLSTRIQSAYMGTPTLPTQVDQNYAFLAEGIIDHIKKGSPWGRGNTWRLYPDEYTNYQFAFHRETDDVRPAVMKIAPHGGVQSSNFNFWTGNAAPTASAVGANNGTLWVSNATLYFTWTTNGTTATTSYVAGNTNTTTLALPYTTDLAMWFKTDTNTYPNGSATNWNDSSGNGFNATSTGYQPTYYTNQINGYGAYAFNRAVSNYLDTTFTAGYANVAVFCVWSNGNSTANQMLVSKRVDTGIVFCGYADTSTQNPKLRFYHRGNDLAVWNDIAISNSWNVCGMQASNAVLYGYAPSNNNTNYTISPGVLGGTTAVRIGGDPPGATAYFWDGRVAEILYYTNAITAPNVSNILWYLRTKYNRP